jgi:hypothetical protein
MDRRFDQLYSSFAESVKCPPARSKMYSRVWSSSPSCLKILASASQVTNCVTCPKIASRKQEKPCKCNASQRYHFLKRKIIETHGIRRIVPDISLYILQELTCIDENSTPIHGKRVAKIRCVLLLAHEGCAANIEFILLTIRLGTIALAYQ